jgi:SAM-dependent methyltransferase/archaellum component FlaC
MIDSKNPEIDVDELMQKIRQKVANHQGRSQLLETNNNADIPNLQLNISYIESLLANAESRACNRTKWPDKLNRFPFNINSKLQKFVLKTINFFFKDQREVNFNLILSLKESVKLNYQLIEQIQNLKTQMDERFSAINTRLQEIDESPNPIDKDPRLNAVDNRIDELNAFLCNVDNGIQGLNNRFSTVDLHFLKMDERLGYVDSRFQGINEILGSVDVRFQGINEQLGSMNTHFQGMNERLGSVDIHFLRMDERLGYVDSRFQGMDERLGAVDNSIHRMDERYIKNESYLKNDLTQQKRLITMFLEEVKKCLPEPLNQEQLQSFINEEPHLLDAFYVVFEDQFRGSREDIFNRLKVYLPLIEEAKVGTSNAPILDVGCGRGEWLELLRESGYTAQGIDTNRVMVEQCQARGISVMEADVINFLRSLPDNTLGAITGFHIIEHLPFTVLIELFDECVRVLQPSGLVIFETPNPDNVLVGSNTFYIDPTHRHPLPSGMVQFVAQSRGLCRTTIMKLHPFPENFRLSGSDVAERFNEYFYGAQDYAIVGYKHE